MRWLIITAVVLLTIGVVAVTVLPLARDALNITVSSLAVIAGLTLVVSGWLWGRQTAKGAVEKQPTLRDRVEMLDRARQHWSEDGLGSSLKSQTQIALGPTHRPEVILQRRMELRQKGRNPQPLPAGTAVSQVFDEVDRGLLILGPPGSGKSTALLELACDLLVWASQDAEQPIPVVFNLSSWSQQISFRDWLVEELHHSYEVPRQIARYWIDHDEILPLLDGLDEVASALRDDCVTAIGAFLGKHSINFVVCGHTDEYQRLNTHLGLQDAVVLQPLTRRQVYDYLQAVGLGEIRSALQADDSLWELVGSLLMLNIVTLAYQRRTVGGLWKAGTLEQQRKRLFADYTERMFARRPITRRYTKAQAKRWLAWLGQSMRKRRQSEFDLDRVQPMWLPTAVQRRLVTLVPAIVSGVVGGLLVGLAVRLAVELAARLGVGLGIGLAGGPGVELLAGLVFALIAIGGGRDYEPAGRLRWPWLGLGVGLFAGLAGGPVVGLVFGLVAMGVGLVYELVRGDSLKGARWSWSRLLSGLGVGLVSGLVAALFAGLARGPVVGLAFGLVAMGVGLVYQLIRVDGMEGARATINPVEQLRWSRPRLGVGLGVGLVSGLGGGFFTALGRWLRGGVDVLRDVVLDYGLGGGAVVAVVVVLVFVLSNGLGSGLAGKTVTPNEGIHRSVRRGVVIGLVGWLGVALVSGLVSAPFYALRLSKEGVELGDGLVNGLAFGLVNGLVLGLAIGLAVGLEFGGIASLRHLTLRGLLVHNGAAPWRYVAFLDDAAERLFLSKSGGSYIFRHPSLLEYFANLKGEDLPPCWRRILGSGKRHSVTRRSAWCWRASHGR